MTNWRQDRIASAIAGQNPMVMAELSGGYAVYGDVQFLPGYCVLLPKQPVASLNELPVTKRTAFLRDMTLLGDAILAATQAQRLNYDILGNTDAFLHAHIFPRYPSEPLQYLKKPVWLYPETFWTDVNYQYQSDRDAPLREQITTYLKANLLH